MTDNQNDELELDVIGLEALPGNFPYCVLTVEKVDSEVLGKVARQFDLEFDCTTLGPGQLRFRVVTKNPQEGQHKLQTLTLTAAALALSSVCPDAGLRLDIQSDFREALTDRKEIPTLVPPSLAGLLVDEATQLYLSQAGFEIEAASPAVHLGAAELRNFAGKFLDQALPAEKRKGA